MCARCWVVRKSQLPTQACRTHTGLVVCLACAPYRDRERLIVTKRPWNPIATDFLGRYRRPKMGSSPCWSPEHPVLYFPFFPNTSKIQYKLTLFLQGHWSLENFPNVFIIQKTSLIHNSKFFTQYKTGFST